MKCPQCSYVSFDYLESCRKCSKDLTAHKSQFGIDFLEPVSIGVLAFIESGARAPVAIATESASFDSDDFKVAGDSTDAAVTVEETATAVMDEPEVAVDVDETAQTPEIPVVAEEAPVEENAFSPDIPDIEEAVVEPSTTEDSIDISIDDTQEDLEIASVSEEADDEVVGESMPFMLDEGLAEPVLVEENEEASDGTVDDISLDTTISGIDIDTDELDMTASSDGFSLDIGDDLDTETQLEITDLPEIEEGEAPLLEIADEQDSDDVMAPAASIDNSSDDVISIDTLDTDSELDVSLDGLDDGNADNNLSIGDELDLSIGGEQIDDLDLNIGSVPDPGGDNEEIQLSLDDLDKSEEDENDKTVFSDDDLDLQIGDDDIDFN